MKIGVFDSGIGGQSVANALHAALPGVEVIFRPDKPEHFPYATKSPRELKALVIPVLQSLVDDGCDILVLACNTVSTTLAPELRKHFIVPIVAIEPMIKPAVLLSRSRKIIVCATPTTLKSDRYGWLKDTYANDCEIIEPDCTKWSWLIENNRMNRQKLHDDLAPGLESGADVIVLGCTHYHWIESDMRAYVGADVSVLQPEQAVTAQVQRVLAQLR